MFTTDLQNRIFLSKQINTGQHLLLKLTIESILYLQNICLITQKTRKQSN